MARRCRTHVLAVAVAAAAMGLAAGVSPVAAQTGKVVARLSVVPITVAMQETVAGRGTASATLSGNALTVEGTFEGLRSPATVARLHLAPAGIRGPAIGELTVTHAVSGTLKGVVQLDARGRDAFRDGALYLQISSEKAPDGNLWGWLLLQEAKQ